MTESDIKTILAQCAQLWPQIEKPFMELMTTLTLREARIIQCLYGIGVFPHTHKELAARFKISTERVEQVRDRAFRKIAHPGRENAFAQLVLACGTLNKKEGER